MTLTQDPKIQRFLLDYDHFMQARAEYKDTRDLLVGALPDYLRHIRAQCNEMTQQELAKALGFDHSYISRAETNRNPSDEFLARLRQFVVNWDLPEFEYVSET